MRTTRRHDLRSKVVSLLIAVSIFAAAVPVATAAVAAARAAAAATTPATEWRSSGTASRTAGGAAAAAAAAAVSATARTRTAFLRTSSLLRVQQLQQDWLENLRGGAAINDDEDEEEEDEEYDEDEDEEYDDDEEEDDDFSLFGDGDEEVGEVSDSAFDDETYVDRMKENWKRTPPVTKAYLSASAAASLLGYLFNKNEFPGLLTLDWKSVLTRLQFWRVLTAFLNFGPFGVGYIMTMHFVWTYMSTLERYNYKEPYNFWIMILFGQACMVLGYPVLKLSPKFLGHNLSTFLVYIWSRYHEGVEVRLFELFEAKAEALPWIFLAQTFLLEGEVPILDLLGIVFGHIYHYCWSAGILNTPAFLRQWYNGDSQAAVSIRTMYKRISADFEMV